MNQIIEILFTTTFDLAYNQQNQRKYFVTAPECFEITDLYQMDSLCKVTEHEL